MIPKTIACDFDGTLCDTSITYPFLGQPNWGLINKLKKEREQGAVFILWTCRTDEHLAIALEGCEEWGIKPDFVNENADYAKEMFGNDPRKIFAHEYWDDRAVHIDFNPRKVVNAND